MKKQKLIWASLVLAAFTAVAALKAQTKPAAKSESSQKADTAYKVDVSLEDKSNINFNYSPKENTFSASGSSYFDSKYLKSIKFDLAPSSGKYDFADFNLTLHGFGKDFCWTPSYEIHSRKFDLGNVYKI